MTTESGVDDAPPPTADDEVPMDKLAKAYRRMQERVQALTSAYETELEQIKAQQDTIRIALKDKMLALGVTSVRTAQGTVSLSTRTRYNTGDWDSFKEFVKQHDAIDLLEKRIAQTNMGQFLKDNPGVLPPGLNSVTEYAVSVRRPQS